MFAFAVWDKRNQALFLARDRMGKKPLFYSQKAGRFAFGSELSVFREIPWISRELSFAALHDYLTFLCIPAPKTIFQEIQKLPPGHSLIWKRGKVKVEPYWELRYSPKLKITEWEAIEEIRRLFREAVNARLMSEVPLGAFLSGGLDSSSVVAVMAKLSSQKIKTFSIGFEEQEFNELPFARIVAKRYQTDHHEEIVRPDAVELLPRLARHFGEPFADASAIPTYYLSKMTRQGVTVALSGDGGDEIFAGYRRHLGFKWAEDYQKKIPAWFRAGFANGSQTVLKKAGRQSLFGAMVRFLQAGELNKSERYLQWVGFLDESKKQSLYRGDFLADMNGYRSTGLIEQLFDQVGKETALDAILSVDTKFYLPNDLLCKVDMMSMAHSLEVRSPFLDTRLVEFVSHLPSEMKLKRGKLKYLVRTAFQEEIPQENLHHRKMGFAVPMARWMREGLRETVREGLFSGQTRIGRYFKKEKMNDLFLAHLSGKQDHAYELWGLLVLEHWHRECL
jgi:asparagine synthase (glutamine-hydrolysing)